MKAYELIFIFLITVTSAGTSFYLYKVDRDYKTPKYYLGVQSGSMVGIDGIDVAVSEDGGIISIQQFFKFRASHDVDYNKRIGNNFRLTSKKDIRKAGKLVHEEMRNYHQCRRYNHMFVMNLCKKLRGCPWDKVQKEIDNEGRIFG